jgi:TRAP-type mannitol/chloroaromatic compound transport system permease large subunit
LPSLVDTLNPSPCDDQEYEISLPVAPIPPLGLLTLPVFLRRGYSKSLACGTIFASGTLGQIIPPSLVLILLSDILGVGLGTLFAAAIVPGLVLAAI